ncbi:MAG: sugar phosphate isomerase/epimerase [Phycisphaerae bacterium]|nr:sugar phosphate isomerase/epimerase [Phycisphaerae bacterium]
MARPISLQLYSVREQLKQDVEGTLQALAEMGYVGLEPAGVPKGYSAEQLRKRITDLGMVVSASQGGLPVGDDARRLLDEAEGLGTKHVVCPGYEPKKFQSMGGLKQAADVMNQAVDNCAKRGMTFGYHNHDFELQLVDGKPALLHLSELTGGKLYNTVDTYWVQVGGQDSVEMIKTLGPCANLLHIKDGPLVMGEPMTAVGKGRMDFPPIVAAAEHAEWLVVELDACATDMMQAVKDSIDYLAAAGLGRRR